MPELPEVETVRRGLMPRLVGRRVVRLQQRRLDLRVPLPAKFASKVEGRGVTGIDRRAKYLLIRLDDGQTLIVHLGMSGRMTLYDAETDWTQATADVAMRLVGVYQTMGVVPPAAMPAQG